jgi:hypothetical protein
MSLGRKKERNSGEDQVRDGAVTANSECQLESPILWKKATQVDKIAPQSGEMDLLRSFAHFLFERVSGAEHGLTVLYYVRD